LFVPAFQREYVWKRDDAKRLLSSLIKDYPTGTMLTWETNHPPELKGKHKYNEKQGAVRLILDGQQRITTLYMLIRGEIPPYYKAEETLMPTRLIRLAPQGFMDGRMYGMLRESSSFPFTDRKAYNITILGALIIGLPVNIKIFRMTK
jgi:hypothetical protein